MGAKVASQQVVARSALSRASCRRAAESSFEYHLISVRAARRRGASNRFDVFRQTKSGSTPEWISAKAPVRPLGGSRAPIGWTANGRRQLAATTATTKPLGRLEKIAATKLAGQARPVRYWSHLLLWTLLSALCSRF